MEAAVTVRLNRAGVAAVLKSASVAGAVRGKAEEVAANVRAQGIMVEGTPGDVALPVEVTSYITDRAAASVTIAHPSGVAVQAKYGALTKAAAEAGLEVTDR